MAEFQRHCLQRDCLLKAPSWRQYIAQRLWYLMRLTFLQIPFLGKCLISIKEVQAWIFAQIVRQEAQQQLLYNYLCQKLCLVHYDQVKNEQMYVCLKYIIFVNNFNNLKMSSYNKKDVSPQPRTVGKGDNKRRRVSLASEQQTEIRQAFDLFDPHRTSHITYHELKVILRALGFDIKKSEIVQLAREFDIEESGRISYEDYVEIMKRKYGQRDPIEQTLKAFRLFDVESRGKISLTDLRRVAKELGEVLKQQQLIAMIQQFDHDNDGQINEQQFLAILRPSII